MYQSVQVSPTVGGACQPWTGALDKDGYPANKQHRRALAAKLGRQISSGMEVLHSCDNRACINQDHLSEGTHAENIAQRDRRGRTQKGERHYRARLTADQVYDVKLRLAAGETGTRIAADLGVGSRCISHIATGKNWKHVQLAVRP